MSAAPTLAALERRAAALVDAAKHAGADACDAIAAVSRSLHVNVRDGKVEENGAAEADELGLRVFVGRRQAVVSTSDADERGFAALAARAVAMARVAPEDPYAGLAPEADSEAALRDLDLHDPTCPTSDRLEALAKEAEAAALAVPGVTKSAGAAAGLSHEGAVLVTSAGFTGSYLRSGFVTAMTAIAGEGTGMQRDGEWSSRVHYEDLEDPDVIGRRAGERAVAALNPRKLETGRCPILVDRRVSPSFVGHLLGAINGAAIARGTSFLKDKRGKRVFAPGIQIVDDPLRPRGPRSRPFDDEGVPSRKTMLVEDGALSTWLLDTATARELGLSTTGHAARGASSTPSPAATNVTLEAGRRSPAQLMRDLGRGILVTLFMGQGANLVTGDYSRGISGFWFENGEVLYPVAEITIAGHLDDIFAALEPADDLEFRQAVNAPSVFIGELTVGGR